MISEEIESLRDEGKAMMKIASIIQSNSAMKITASEIAENYASPGHT